MPIFRTLRTETLFACLILTLSGCAGYGKKNLPEEILLPPLPADLLSCFDDIVPPPALRQMSKQDVIRLIAALKKSEAEKQACGRRAIAFYEKFQKQKK